MTEPKIAKDDPRLARPLFSLNEAAGYLGIPYSTLYQWARPRRGEPLIYVTPAQGREPVLPFIGFAEAFVLQAARKAGVPRHRIRPNVEELRNAYPSIEHLLATQRVYTDGAEILVQSGDGDGDLEVPRLKQRQLTETVKDQLKLIRYADDGYARRLQLPRYQEAAVVVDPEIAAGRPLTMQGIRVKDLEDRYRGGDSEKAIARSFGVPLATVEALVGNP